MKKIVLIAGLAVMAAFQSCYKEPDKVPVWDPPSGNTYATLQQFYDASKPAVMNFTVNNQTGGSFTTPQGTVVTVPANAFVTQSNGPVTGIVNVEFLDVFKKSDMLYLNMGTSLAFGGALKSTGEFFIRASQNNIPVILNGTDAISVELPAGNNPIDTAMAAFDAIPDSANNMAWWFSSSNTLVATQTNYIFSMYQFANPASNGTWCNSDASAFASVPQTSLVLDPTDDPNDYTTDVFLIFTGVNSMIHVYGNIDQNNNVTFPYYYAPIGYQVTAVAIGEKDGKLYSSFTPITIGTNQTVNFTLSETTDTAFRATLDALN